MVLELGGDDDVTGTYGAGEPVVPQHVGRQVDRLGRVLGEHQFIGVAPTNAAISARPCS